MGCVMLGLDLSISGPARSRQKILGPNPRMTLDQRLMREVGINFATA